MVNEIHLLVGLWALLWLFPTIMPHLLFEVKHTIQTRREGDSELVPSGGVQAFAVACYETDITPDGHQRTSILSHRAGPRAVDITSIADFAQLHVQGKTLAEGISVDQWIHSVDIKEDSLAGSLGLHKAGHHSEQEELKGDDAATKLLHAITVIVTTITQLSDLKVLLPGDGWGPVE
mmetsp:Transcript_429/g.659  ORF Transcript_429/g.659 Transcript_429/m.659 type:complete len:177 (+) Transcript_429:1385-1915(+)